MFPLYFWCGLRHSFIWTFAHLYGLLVFYRRYRDLEYENVVTGYVLVLQSFRRQFFTTESKLVVNRGSYPYNDGDFFYSPTYPFISPHLIDDPPVKLFPLFFFFFSYIFSSYRINCSNWYLHIFRYVCLCKENTVVSGMGEEFVFVL